MAALGLSFIYVGVVGSVHSVHRLLLSFRRRDHLHLVIVDGAFPLEHAPIVAAHGDEEASVWREEALRDLVKVVLVALVVALIAEVGIAVEADGANFIAHGDDRLAPYLDNICDLVLAAVLLADGLEGLVRAKTFMKPFQLEVKRVGRDLPACLDLEQVHLTNRVFALQIVVVR